MMTDCDIYKIYDKSDLSVLTENLVHDLEVVQIKLQKGTIQRTKTIYCIYMKPQTYQLKCLCFQMNRIKDIINI